MAEHEHDLEADFLRFYRIDMYSLDFPKLFRLAERVFAYGGVMATLRDAEVRAHQPHEVLRPVPQVSRPQPLAPVVRVSPGAELVPFGALMAKAAVPDTYVRVKKKTAA